MPNFKNDKELFISTLVATMYHMALVDGKYDPSEKAYIAKVIKEYKDYINVIKEVTS